MSAAPGNHRGEDALWQARQIALAIANECNYAEWNQRLSRIIGPHYKVENATSSRFRLLEANLLAVQCRMARTALGWSVKDLANAANVSTNTIVRLERGEALKPRTVADIRETLEKAGVTFIDGEYAGGGGPGVRLSKEISQV